MNPGKALEIFVKRLLLCVGFSEVRSDGLYIYDAAAGQMIQGLGEAHNANVLLKPPVQTPFFALSRLLVECKDYNKRIGLGTVRGVLGLKQDINNFDIVDINELNARRNTRRTDLTYKFNRYYYQVAMVSMNGFTLQAQKFAATYRIPLIEFNKMPFWTRFVDLLSENGVNKGRGSFYSTNKAISDAELETKIVEIADEIGQSMALAITNSGQLLFLFNRAGKEIDFDDYYQIHWNNQDKGVWRLSSGNCNYLFQLPSDLMKAWINSSNGELEMRRNALNCKAEWLSSMVVYYIKNSKPKIKMISIDRYQLEKAKAYLGS